jgi:hypothetical protein
MQDRLLLQAGREGELVVRHVSELQDAARSMDDARLPDMAGGQ